MGFKKIHKVNGVISFRFQNGLASANYFGACLELQSPTRITCEGLA